MKKILLLTAVGTVLSVPAFAVVQCVKGLNNTDAAPCSSSSGTSGYTYSGMTCNGVKYESVALCSETSGNVGDTTDRLKMYAYNDGVDAQKNCWCKLVSPVNSLWVMARVYEGSIKCRAGCYNYCEYMWQSTSPAYYREFRQAVIDSMYF